LIKKNETKGGKLTLLDRGWSTPIGWVAEFRGGSAGIDKIEERGLL
jgi:hypothetical protein